MASGGDMTSVLRTLQGLNSSERLKADAAVHIDAVTDCIKDLYEATRLLKEEYETVTIKEGVLRHRLADKAEIVGAEMDAEVGIAKQINRDLTTELREETDQLSRQIEISEEGEKRIKKENEKLLEIEQATNDYWSFKMNSMENRMRRKSRGQLQIQDTRCKTDDAHKHAIELAREAEELTIDLEDYWNYYYEQTTELKADAGTLISKIAAQDEQTAKAKSLYEEVERQRESLMRDVTVQEATTRDYEAKRSAAIVKRENLQITLPNKRNRLNEVVEERENIQHTLNESREKYEQVLNLTVQGQEVLEAEMESELDNRKELVEKVQVMREIVKGKRKEVKYKMDITRTEKGVVVDIRNMIRSLLENVGSAREERYELKRRITDVTEEAELRKTYLSRVIDKLKAKLDCAFEIRKSAENKFEESLERIDVQEKEMAEFENEHNNNIRLLVDKKEMYQREKKEIEKGDKSLASKRVEAIRGREKSKKHHQVLIKDLNEEIEKRKENVQKTKITVEELEKIASDMEPVLQDTAREYNDAKTRVGECREMVTTLNRNYKDMCDALEHQTIETVSMQRDRAILRKKLESTNREICEEIESAKDVKEVNRMIYEQIKRQEKVENVNKNFSTSCNKLISKIKEEKRILSDTEKSEGMEKKHEEVRRKLTELLVIEAEISNQARTRDEELIKDISSKKEFLSNRKVLLDGITARMEKILFGMEKLNS